MQPKWKCSKQTIKRNRRTKKYPHHRDRKPYHHHRIPHPETSLHFHCKMLEWMSYFKLRAVYETFYSALKTKAKRARKTSTTSWKPKFENIHVKLERFHVNMKDFSTFLWDGTDHMWYPYELWREGRYSAATSPSNKRCLDVNVQRSAHSPDTQRNDDRNDFDNDQSAWATTGSHHARHPRRTHATILREEEQSIRRKPENHHPAEDHPGSSECADILMMPTLPSLTTTGYFVISRSCLAVLFFSEAKPSRSVLFWMKTFQEKVQGTISKKDSWDDKQRVERRL